MLLDGDLEFQDLGDIPRKYREAYSFLYFVGADNANRVNSMSSSPFRYNMRGGWVYRTIFKELGKDVPALDKPKLQAVTYASPGVIDMQVNPAVADLVKQSIESFIAHETMAERLYLHLDRWVKGKEAERSSPEAMSKVLGELGDLLGGIDVPLLHKMAESVNQAAKIMIAYYRRLRKLAEFRQAGKAVLT